MQTENIGECLCRKTEALFAGIGNSAKEWNNAEGILFFAHQVLFHIFSNRLCYSGLFQGLADSEADNETILPTIDEYSFI